MLVGALEVKSKDKFLIQKTSITTMSNRREEFYDQISDKDEERKFGSELEP